jgi:hypothetical protein
MGWPVARLLSRTLGFLRSSDVTVGDNADDHDARHRRWFAAGLAVLIGAAASLGCTNGSADSTRKAEDVPIPHVKLPASLSFDNAAWLELWRQTPGTPRERCLDVGRRTDVRSGGFVVGNFAAFRDGWDGTEATSKLYYIPLRPDPPAPLVVTATRLLVDPPLVVTLKFDPPQSWTLGGAPFYPSGTVLPERGHWRLEAVAGRNRGCFELQL